ncbi:MAG: hypothetical protein QOD93_2273 [Acetobacteraceae bacterium]|jgi:2-dehydropantoate 2-reductase|nr:hypothetical protein [Acetobacteraceae bacterium]
MADRILIWGAGAIGGTAGAFLKRASNDITFVDSVAERGPERGVRHTTGRIARLRPSRTWG